MQARFVAGFPSFHRLQISGRGIASRSRSVAMSASQDAYMDSSLRVPAIATSGPLAGKTFAVKDLFDIKGHRTGFGNPTWLETHKPAEGTAPAVQLLLDAGASVSGKTHMDELAYSLNGENAHYGTPCNPAAPGRIPGGSSSGSAAACAAADVDFALGSDTGGSVRIPASYCGLYGFRPTHGRISLDLARPLAPSFDTVGFFTRDATLLNTVGAVLLKPSAGKASSKPLSRWLVAKDAFALAEPATMQAIYQGLSRTMAGVTRILGSPTELDVCDSTHLSELGVGKLTDWFDVFRVCQAYEVWQAHGDWIQQHNPDFGPGIRDRFDMAAKITEEERDACAKKMTAVRAHLHQLLGDDGILTIPTAPGPAPLLATPPQQLDVWRRSMISLTCIAGLAGLPQVTLPLADVEGLPVGLSLIGPAGADEELLAIAKSLADLSSSPPA